MDFNSHNPKKLITRQYVFNFGKYKGYDILEVIEDDPQYVLWCTDEIDWFDLDTELYDQAYEYYLDQYDGHDIDYYDYDPSRDYCSREYYERRYAEACSYSGLDAKKVDGCWVPDND